MKVAVEVINEVGHMIRYKYDEYGWQQFNKNRYIQWTITIIIIIKLKKNNNSSILHSTIKSHFPWNLKLGKKKTPALSISPLTHMRVDIFYPMANDAAGQMMIT